MKEEIQAAIIILQPLVELIITVAAPVVMTAISAKLVSIMHIKAEDQKATVEQKVRSALHEAAENALLYAMTRYGFRMKSANLSESLPYISRMAAAGDNKSIATMENVVASAVDDYLVKKMPGTISKLKASKEDLADIVMSKIPKV